MGRRYAARDQVPEPAGDGSTKSACARWCWPFTRGPASTHRLSRGSPHLAQRHGHRLVAREERHDRSVSGARVARGRVAGGGSASPPRGRPAGTERRGGDRAAGSGVRGARGRPGAGRGAPGARPAHAVPGPRPPRAARERRRCGCSTSASRTRWAGCARCGPSTRRPSSSIRPSAPRGRGRTSIRWPS